MTHQLYANLIRGLFDPRQNAALAAEGVPSVAQQREAEETVPYQFLTEKHLQILWLEQKYFYPLISDDGVSIKVLSPGVWNAEAGPDFLQAHLKIGDQEFRGDIELHLSEESWYDHKHHLNPAYNRVILHISYWKSSNPREIVNAQKSPIPSVHLEPFLTLPEWQLTKIIDIDLYPHKYFSGSGRCSHTLFNSLSEEETLKFFRSAAAWRLIQKKQYLESRAVPHTDLLKTGMAWALGYKKNSERFLELFHILVKCGSNEEEFLLSRALGLCGFFAPYYQKKWEGSAYFHSLLSLFLERGQEETSYLVKLHLGNIRPANHPVRRLALLVKLVCSRHLDFILEQMRSLWKAEWQLRNGLGWHKMRKELVALLPTYQDPYWETHYTFEKEQQSKPIALIGEDLKLELLVNVCLPIIYADVTARNNSDEQRCFQMFYASIPAVHTKKAEYLSHRFFGNGNKSALFVQADTQQGAYQLHHDFCVHYEASCEGCTFVNRYNKYFNPNL